MTVREIVEQYLQAHGYDGLYDSETHCACLTGDLMCCVGPADTCQAGYKRNCDCGEGCDFHVGEEKP